MDDAKFEEVWSQYAPGVLRYCTFSVGSTLEGEDIAAETFAQYLIRGDRVPPAKTEAWLIKVARNLCASHHRSVFRARRLQDRLANELSKSEDEWVRPYSWDCLGLLKEFERLLLYLRIAEERPFCDIASRIGKSEAATKMAYYRAAARLRNLLIEQGAGVGDSMDEMLGRVVTGAGLSGGTKNA